MVDDTDLHEVLGHGSALNVVAIGFRDPSEEVDGVGVGEVEVDVAKNVAFGFEDFVVFVSTVSHVEEVGNGRAHHFLVLGSDEEGGNSDELKFNEGDDTGGEEAIDDVGREEDGFGEEAEFGVNLDEPVNQDSSHFPGNLVLIRHVVDVRHSRELWRRKRGERGI